MSAGPFELHVWLGDRWVPATFEGRAARFASASEARVEALVLRRRREVEGRVRAG